MLFPKHPAAIPPVPLRFLKNTRKTELRWREDFVFPEHSAACLRALWAFKKHAQNGAPVARRFRVPGTFGGPASGPFALISMKLSKTYELVTCSFGAGASPLRVALRTGRG